MANTIYERNLVIPAFSGINQSGDGYNMNMAYAVEMENVNVTGGSFSPMREGIAIAQELSKPIATLMFFHRRWGSDKTTLLVAVSNGRVYTKHLDGSDDWVKRYPAETTSTEEVDGETVTVTTETSDPLSVSDCDWAAYEIPKIRNFHTFETYVVGSVTESSGKYVANEGFCIYDGSMYICTTAITEPDDWDGDNWSKLDYVKKHAYAVGDLCYYNGKLYRCKTAITSSKTFDASKWDEVDIGETIDALLFTNAADGMFCLYGNDLHVSRVDTPYKFGVLTVYNERLFGSGITDEPDTLVYSVPFDPFDWSQNNEVPEDGGGEIKQPTWDGDKFLALKQHGGNLLAFKRNSMWRIYGTNPGEYIMQRQYGGGTIVENSVAVYGDNVYMLGASGIMIYDGVSVKPFLHEETRLILKDKVNQQYLSKAHGAIRNGVYCLSLPVNGSTFCNSILEYNIEERTIAFRTSVSVAAFLQMNERLFYTSATEPGKVFELSDEKGLSLPCVWRSGYQDLGVKNSVKSAFVLYLSIEAETPLELRVAIRTEKKTKRKIFNVKPGKMSRLHLNTQGRLFQLEIQSYSAVPFIIAGGYRLDLELDPD